MQQLYTISQLQLQLEELSSRGSALEQAFARDVQACWQQLPLQQIEDQARWNLHLPSQLPFAICLSNQRVHLLSAKLIAVWQQLQSQAAADGVELYIISAFRGIKRQHGIIMRKMASGLPLQQILSVNALPGCSEHHSGLALDLGTQAESDLEESFAESEAYGWLQQHAATYGFSLSFPQHNPQGYIYEPWHWCWQPDGR